MSVKREIVFLTHYNTMNGANQSLFTLLERLNTSYNIKVYIHNPDQSKDGLFGKIHELGNIKVENTILISYLYFKSKFLGFCKLPLNFLRSFIGFVKIIQYCKEKKVELVYSNSSVESYGLIIAKFLKIKHIWHIREFGFLDYSLNHVGGDLFKRCLFRQSSLVVAISKAIYQYVSTENCKLVYNGVVDISDISPLGRSIQPDTKPLRLGVVGLISKTKNQMIVINVVKNLLDRGYVVYLDLWGDIGDYDYKIEIDKYLKANNLESHVSFKGFEGNKEKIYSEMDILVMSSPFEAFGRVTIEAMSRGIIVIGNNSAGTKELIEDNLSGLLYSGISHLEEQVVSIIDDKELYKTISIGSINQAKNFTIQKYVDGIDKTIQSIISE